MKSFVWIVVVVVVVVVVASLSVVHCSQLRVDPTNPLRAYGNGTVFDISKVFQWPVTINDDPRGYQYWYNPTGRACQTQPTNTAPAVCQKADTYYNCGEWASPVWTFDGFEQQPVRFHITYLNGIAWRLTQITFVVDAGVNTTVPAIRFLSEHPYEQYNFEVRGPCVGQPFAPSFCH
eukprot:TRINITY_DN2285_c0_g1_i1.p1 TRINITY_DN2285_c0_g1~~TRINITY_DN2285_c0_g1_i1.p1  ORF type:complete len:177 (-),score=15.46 TRINITY_DN2285_c0_g1_i1:115-645(-)